jgi:hypothetical protein
MSKLPPIPPLTFGGTVRYIPRRKGATPAVPMNGASGIRARVPVSEPTKDAKPEFWPRSKVNSWTNGAPLLNG